jgi:hypothetical protein
LLIAYYPIPPAANQSDSNTAKTTELSLHCFAVASMTPVTPKRPRQLRTTTNAVTQCHDFQSSSGLTDSPPRATVQSLLRFQAVVPEIDVNLRRASSSHTLLVDPRRLAPAHDFEALLDRSFRLIHSALTRFIKSCTNNCGLRVIHPTQNQFAPDAWSPSRY